LTYVFWFWFIIVILCLLCCFFIGCLVYTCNLKNNYLNQWSKWENEYWMLRNSPAVDLKNYSIYLSWSERGFDNCIEKIQKKEKDVKNETC